MHSPLTDRQERFVLEYLKDQNASAAAARAGYTARNLAAQGCELMKIPAVRHRVRAGMQSQLAELRCSALSLMRQRMRAALFRADKMFMHGWEPYALDEMDEETRCALEVTVTMRNSGPVVRMRQPCRARALRALERVHERLDVLNERYYARLERAGMVPGTQELERMLEAAERGEQVGQGGEAAPEARMDAGPETDPPATGLTQKPQVLSGSGTDASCRTAFFDRLRTSGGEGGGVNFPEKPQVLSGSGPEPEPVAAQNAQKPQVLSGSQRPARDALEAA